MAKEKTKAPLEVGTNQAEFLEFSIEQRLPDGSSYRALYGINVFKVRHVIPMPQVTPFPLQTEYVEGVFRFRGENLILINLPRYLQVSEAHVTDRMVIVAEFNDIRVGFTVHGAHNIRRLSSDQLRPPPDTQKESLYKGINFFALVDNTLLRVLDVEEVLASLGMSNAILSPEKLDAILAETMPALLAPAPGATTQDAFKPATNNVLVVDDSALVRTTLAKLLGRAGLNVLVARNGQEAWERISTILTEARRQGRPFHELLPVAIIDIEMPQIDGFALTRLIKQTPDVERLKVLLHTSLGGPENVYKGYRVGADEFLVKFNPKRILEMTYRMLRG